MSSPADEPDAQPAGSLAADPQAGRRGHGRGLRPRSARSPRPGAPTRMSPRSSAIDDRRGDVDGVTWRVVDVCDPALAGRIGKVDIVVHLDVDTVLDARRRERAGAQRARDADGDHGGGGDRCTSRGAGDVGDGLRRAARQPGAAGRGRPAAGHARRVLRLRPARDRAARRAGAAHAPRTVGHRAAPRDRGRPRHRQHHDPALRGAAAARRARLARRAGSSATSTTWSRRSSWPRSGRSPASVTVGCDGWLEQDGGRAGRPACGASSCPSALAFGTAERLHRIGVIPAPASDLQYVVHPWVVPSTRLLEAGLATDVRQPDGARPAARAGQRPPRAGLPAGRPARRDGRRCRRRGRRGRHGRARARAPKEAARMSGPGEVLRLLGVRDAAALGRRGAARPSPTRRRRHRVFVGTVRDAGRRPRRSTGLGYSAHPSVEDALRSVAEEVVADASGARPRRRTSRG